MKGSARSDMRRSSDTGRLLKKKTGAADVLVAVRPRRSELQWGV